MDARLAWLHFRRGARPWVWIATGALVALAILRDSGDVGGPGPAATWTRTGVWSAALLVVWPAALVHAAGLLARWRAGELDWIAPRARALGGALVSSWIGAVGAAWCACLAVAVVAELAGGAPPDLVDRGWIDGAREERDAADAFAFALDAPTRADGAWLAVPVDLRGHRGRLVDARLTLRRGEATSAWDARLTRAGEFLVALPAGAEPVHVTIEAVSSGAALSVPRVGARLLEPAGRFAGAWSVVSRVALAVALSLALAVGLGAWCSAAGACVGAATPWIVAWFGDAAWPLPARDLFVALDELVRGRALAPPDVATVAVTVAGCAVALGLARAGLARRGRGA